MEKRDYRRLCYKERLEKVVKDVEIIENRIFQLNHTYQNISEDIINKELEDCYCDLELSLATMAIIIRKLVENQFTKISEEDRADINALIHSNRFDYLEDQIKVYSRLSSEDVDVDHMIELGKTIIQQLN